MPNFDELMNIDTQGWIYWPGENDPGFHYHRSEPTEYIDLNELFIHYDLPEDAHFVDIGCGKGRVMFYVNYFYDIPVTGIELHKDVFPLLEKNIEKYRKSNQDHALIEAKKIPAQNYSFKSDQNVIYMFNPFTVNIFSQVIDNLIESVQLFPREVDLILYYPVREFREYIKKNTNFVHIDTVRLEGYLDQTERFEIYRLFKESI